VEVEPAARASAKLVNLAGSGGRISLLRAYFRIELRLVKPGKAMMSDMSGIRGRTGQRWDTVLEES
jgi:hypothetical protein